MQHIGLVSRGAVKGLPDYNVQTAVDGANKLLVDFEVTNDALDKNKLHLMLSRSAEILDVDDLAAVADMGYDSATDIAKSVMDGFDTHIAGVDITICVPDTHSVEEITSQVNGRCVYLAERNIAVCPMGYVMRPARYKNREGKAVFHNFRLAEHVPADALGENTGSLSSLCPLTSSEPHTTTATFPFGKCAWRQAGS